MSPIIPPSAALIDTYSITASDGSHWVGYLIRHADRREIIAYLPVLPSGKDIDLASNVLDHWSRQPELQQSLFAEGLLG